MAVRACFLGTLCAACAAAPAAPVAPPRPPTSAANAPAVTRPAPPEAPAAPRPLPGQVGTSDPLLLRAVAPDGGWAVVCQARADTDGDGVIAVSVGPRGQLAGDRLVSYLIEGSGEGEPIDAFVAADPSGRHLVIERGGRLLLRDSWNQSDIDLSERGAVTGSDKSPFAPHRAASFSDDGRKVLHLRRRGAREDVVVLDLESGAETVFDPGEGLLWRAEFDSSSEWLVLRVVDADTNADGRWSLPHGKPGPSDSPCTSPVPEYRAPVVPPDKPSVRVAKVSGGPVRQVRGFVTSFGPGGVLRRQEDRALFVDRPGGSVELWSGSSCDGRLLQADPARQLLLVACATEEGPRTLRLVERDAQQDLDIVVGPFEVDTVIAGAPRLIPVYAFPAPGTLLVDLERRQVIPLLPRDKVVATHAANVLVRRGEELFLGDATKSLARLGAVDLLSPVLRQSALVFMAPWVVDMARGRAVGQVTGEALALSRQGAVLVARVPADAQHVAQGPLSWVNPAPAR